MTEHELKNLLNEYWWPSDDNCGCSFSAEEAAKEIHNLLTQAHTQWKAEVKQELSTLNTYKLEEGDVLGKVDVLNLPSLQDTEKETDAS